MELLKNHIEKFNKTMGRLFADTDLDPDLGPFYAIKKIEIADTEQLNKLQTYFDREIPPELATFYQQFGGLKNYAFDNFMLQIPSISELLEQLNSEKNYEKRYSMGLIDGIKQEGDNDRPEFDYIPKSEIDSINTNYKCIGLYRFDWQFSEAYFIYFDKNNQFGLVRYHREGFDELWDEHLTPMLTQSQAKQTLQELIIQIIDHLEVGIIADEEDN